MARPTAEAGRIGFLVVLLAAVSLTAACGKKAPPFLTVPVAAGSLSVSKVVTSGEEVRVTFRVPRERLSFGKEEEPWVLARMLRRPSRDGEAGFEERAVIVEEEGLAFGESLTLIDTGLVEGEVYLYRVELRKQESEEWAATDTLTVEAIAAPEAPRELRAEGTEGAVVLSWSPPGGGRAGVEYVVFKRGAEESESAPVTPGPQGNTAFTDTRVEREREYCYRVQAILRSLETEAVGGTTDEVCVRAEDRSAPPGPSGLRAVADSRGVELTWLPVAARDVKGYNVYRAEGEGPFRIVNASPLEAARYRDEKVVSGMRYRYRVTAVDDSERGNESPFAEASAVTPPAE
jgi:hypothetical protein